MPATDLATSNDTRHRPNRQPKMPVWWPHALLGILFAAAWTVLSVSRTLRGDDITYDLGIFTEAVKGYAHLGAPIVDIKGPGFNILGDHWSPILAVLAPFWWIWPSPLMLQTAQALLFGSSVAVVSSTATRILGRGRGIPLALAYGLSFGLQQAVDAGFHEYAFAVPLLAMVMRQLLLDRPVRAVWWALPLLLVKEDLGLTVAAVGILVAVRWRRRILGGLVALAGVGGTLAEMSVLIPMFNPGHHYAYLGELPAHAGVWQLLLALVWPGVKLQTLGWTFGASAFLCLRSPLVALAVPGLLWRFESTHSVYWGIGWHYSAPLMPVVFLAAVDGIRRIDAAGWAWMRAWARQAPGALAGAAIACCAAIPLGVTDLVNSGTYPHGPHTAALAAAERVIPPGVTVAADTAQLSVLAARDDASWAGTGDDQVAVWPRPEYIVTDQAWWDVGPNVAAWAEGIHPGTVYRVVFQQDGVTVLRLAG